MKHDEATVPPAPLGQVERRVGRLESERAKVGDTVECDVREPYPQTHRLTLETQAATDYANELLARAGSGWRLAPMAMPAACTTPRGCRDRGCRGECLPPNVRANRTTRELMTYEEATLPTALVGPVEPATTARGER